MYTPFFKSTSYQPLYEEVGEVPVLESHILLSNRIDFMYRSISDDFHRPWEQRYGILHGEYILLGNGMVLLDRSCSITVTCSEYTSWIAAAACEFPEVVPVIRETVRRWDELLVVQYPYLLSDPWANNYYHFSMSLAPRLRYIADKDHPVRPVMPEIARTQPFQVGLLTRILGRQPYPLSTPLRVRDPVISHDGDIGCKTGLNWLRQASGLAARDGSRRIYLRRSSGITRLAKGGGISESPGFLALMRDFGFETVEFGGGERSVEEQVAMLDGAGLILSPNGAAMTNIAYLQGRVTVIEILGSLQINACFMRMCSILGFGYHGICSEVYDVNQNIVVDLDELHDAISLH